MIHKGKVTFMINRPAYVGMCILDLSSKVLMCSTYMKNHNSIKCFSFMTCTALTTLVKPVAHDASKSNIFTHYIALNTTIITQYSDQQICNSNSFNKSRATIAFICEFVFQTTVSTKRYIVPKHLSSMADNLACQSDHCLQLTLLFCCRTFLPKLM